MSSQRDEINDSPNDNGGDTASVVYHGTRDKTGEEVTWLVINLDEIEGDEWIETNLDALIQLEEMR